MRGKKLMRHFNTVPKVSTFRGHCIVKIANREGNGRCLGRHSNRFVNSLVSHLRHRDLVAFLHVLNNPLRCGCNSTRPLGVLGKQSDQDVIEECLEQLGDEVERLCNEEQVERMNLALSYHPFYTTDGMDVHKQASYGRLAMEHTDLDTLLMLSYLLALPQPASLGCSEEARRPKDSRSVAKQPSGGLWQLGEHDSDFAVPMVLAVLVGSGVSGAGRRSSGAGICAGLCEDEGGVGAALRSSLEYLLPNGDVDLSIHVSLLKKFKSAVRGMDYKTLMTGEDSVSVLRPALLATNVHLIAKLAAKIPCKACDNGFLSSEVVFRVFAEKLFMTGDGKQTEPLDKLPLSTRIELLGQLLKLWRRALNGASSAEVTGSSEEGHNSVAMEMALEHLRSVHTVALKRPQECSEEQWSSFMNELEFSFSQTDKVYAVCSKMVASGLRLDVVGTVLDLTHKVQPHTMSVLSLVQEALSHALEELRHTDSEPQDALCKIETVISSVRQHEQESGRLVSSGQVLAIIRPHCSDSSHTVDTRRALLHIIEKHLTLSEDDLNLLILYQTQAILLNQFAVEATLEHVSSAQGRTALFTTLLRQASTLDQLQVLECLLETWGEDSRFPVQESWCELMEAMSSVAEGATGVILARAGRSHVPEEVDEAIWHKLSSGSVVDGLKYSLVAGGVVMKKSLEQLQQECSAPIMSADVFELLIVKKQVSLVVSLPFYIQLSAHLQSPQEDISTELFTKVLSSQLQSSLNGCLSTNRPSVLGRLHSSCLMVASRLSWKSCVVHSAVPPKHPHCQ
eukprot:Em0009g268a